MKRWRIDALARRVAVAALAFCRRRCWLDVGRAPNPQHRSRAAFHARGLERVGDYIRNEIATGKFPGAILLIQQHGKPVYFENFGVRDVATKFPMSADTIFRLYSMSKPITSVAAMMLVEDGKLTARRSRLEIHSGLCGYKGRRREARRRMAR